MDDEQTIRATSDRMLDIIDRLRGIEVDKRREALGSPRFVELAHEAENLSRLVTRWAGLQLQLAAGSTGAVVRGEMPKTAIENIKPRPLERILAAWREAQMRFELAVPGSPEAAAAADDVVRERDEFQRVQKLRRS